MTYDFYIFFMSNLLFILLSVFLFFLNWFYFLIFSLSLGLLRIEFHYFFFVRTTSSHNPSHEYEMLVWVDINILFFNHFIHLFFFSISAFNFKFIKFLVYLFFLYAFYEEVLTSRSESQVFHVNSDWIRIFFFIFHFLSYSSLSIKVYNLKFYFALNHVCNTLT